MATNSSFIGYLGIILAIVGWGLSASFIGFGLKNISPFLFLSLRFLVAVIIFTPYVVIFKRHELFHLLNSKWVWIIAFFEFLGLELQYFGQQSISAGLATLLSLQFVLFVPFLSVKFLKEPFSKIIVISIVFALIGSLLISTDGNFSDLLSNLNVGAVFLLLSALAYSFYIIFSSKFGKQASNSIDSSVLFFSIILGVALYSIIPTVMLTSSFYINSSIWTWVIALAIFSTLIPFFGYFLGLKVVSANTMSLVLPLQIIVPFIIDIVFLGITYSYWILIGSLLIVGSLAIFISKPIIDRLQLEPIFTKIFVTSDK